MNKVILKTKKYSLITLIMITSFVISTIVCISQRKIVNLEEIAINEELLKRKKIEVNELEQVIEEKQKFIEELEKYINEKEKAVKKTT